MGFNPLGMHSQHQQQSESNSTKKPSHAPSEKARRDRINEYIDKLRQVSEGKERERIEMIEIEGHCVVARNNKREEEILAVFGLPRLSDRLSL